MARRPTALVFGARGRIGRALLAGVPSGWDAIGLSRNDLNLRDSDAVTAAVRSHQPDLVLNAAAFTDVDRAEAHAEEAFAVNAGLVGVLSAAVAQVGAQLVHLSTDFVFGGEKGRPYRPSDPCAPLSVYGRSKAAGEAQAGPDATIVRTSWVYGGCGPDFVTTMLQLMRSQSEIRVVSDQISSPTWAYGLAQIVWQLGVGRKAGIWHYSDAGVASKYDFACAIEEEAFCLGLLERRVPVIPVTTDAYKSLATRPCFSLLDSRATLDACNLLPTHWRHNLRGCLAEKVRQLGRRDTDRAPQ